MQKIGLVLGSTLEREKRKNLERKVPFPRRVGVDFQIFRGIRRKRSLQLGVAIHFGILSSAARVCHLLSAFFAYGEWIIVIIVKCIRLTCPPSWDDVDGEMGRKLQ